MSGWFGVPSVDRELGGDVDADRPVGRILVRHDPSIPGRPWLLAAAARVLANGGTVIAVATTSRVGTLTRDLAGMPGAAQGTIIAVDAQEGAYGFDDAAFRVADPSDMDDVIATIDEAQAAHPDALVLVESLSALVDRCGRADFRSSWPHLRRVVAHAPAFISSWTTWPYAKDIDRVDTAFDDVVALKGVEQHVLRNHVVAVTRHDGRANEAPRWRLTTVDGQGRPALHVPKLVVVGPADAGKTTFVHAASTRAVSAERNGITVAIDRGQLQEDGLIVDLFGAPGQARFRPMLRNVLDQATGAVVLVDGNDEATMTDARDVLRTVRAMGLHTAIAVTKQDLANALSPEQVQAFINGDAARVHGVVASKRRDARRVIDELVNEILEGNAP